MALKLFDSTKSQVYPQKDISFFQCTSFLLYIFLLKVYESSCAQDIQNYFLVSHFGGETFHLHKGLSEKMF